MIEDRTGFAAHDTVRMPLQVRGSGALVVLVISTCAGAGAACIALGLAGLGAWTLLACGHDMATTGTETWCCSGHGEVGLPKEPQAS